MIFDSRSKQAFAPTNMEWEKAFNDGDKRQNYKGFKAMCNYIELQLHFSGLDNLLRQLNVIKE